jgi:hypothetical protein
MATATPIPEAKTERGLLLPCPLCGEAEATVQLNLADLDTCTCLECDAEFSLDELAGRLARWQALLAWRDLAPRPTSQS